MTGRAVVVDAERCTGHGRCYAQAPAVFDSDDEGFPVVLTPEVAAGSDQERQAEAAARNCPEAAIRLDA